MPDSGEFHIGEQLGFVDTEQAFHAFEFEDYLMVHQNINAISAVQSKSLVFHRKRMLQKEGNTLEFQLVGEALLVG